MSVPSNKTSPLLMSGIPLEFDFSDMQSCFGYIRGTQAKDIASNPFGEISAGLKTLEELGGFLKNPPHAELLGYNIPQAQQIVGNIKEMKEVIADAVFIKAGGKIDFLAQNILQPERNLESIKKKWALTYLKGRIENFMKFEQRVIQPIEDALNGMRGSLKEKFKVQEIKLNEAADTFGIDVKSSFTKTVISEQLNPRSDLSIQEKIDIAELNKLIDEKQAILARIRVAYATFNGFGIRLASDEGT